MTEISRTVLFGKLNPLAYRAIEGATVFCKLRGNPYVELAHWLHQILQTPDSDLHRIVRHFDIEASRLAADLTAALDRLPRGATAVQDFSPLIEETIEDSWVCATLMFNVTQIRTAHLLLAMLRTTALRNALLAISRQWDKVKPDDLADAIPTALKDSPEAALPATDGAAVPGEASGAMAPAPMGKQEALAKFAVDLTERARAGQIDPVTGRDTEIRQLIDVLMRRRQNNPILTRRGRRRQNRRSRRLRPAHRRRRRPPAAAGHQPARARCRPAAGRRQHEGRVRKPAAPGDRGGAILSHPHHPVHRRSPHADRRRRRRRHRRCRQFA